MPSLLALGHVPNMGLLLKLIPVVVQLGVVELHQERLASVDPATTSHQDLALPT